MNNSSASFGLSIVHQQGRMKLRPRRTTCRLPLAPIVPPRLLLDRLATLSPPTAQLQFSLDLIQQPGFADSIHEKLRHAERVRRHVSRHFSPADIQLLADSGTLEEGIASLVLPAFKVPKKQNDARFVVDGRRFNDLLGDMRFPTALPDIQDVADDLRDHRWVFTADARSWFYQIPICARLGSLLGVCLASRRGSYASFIHKALSMGIRPAPFIAQEIATHVANASLEPGVIVRVWIDNFVFLSDDRAAIERTRARFLRACAKTNLVLGTCTGVGSSGEVLGMQFDEHSVSVAADTKRSLAQTLESWKQNRTARSLLQFTGTAIWVNHCIARQPLARYAPIFAEVSAAVTLAIQTDDWDIKLNATLQIDQALEAWCSSLASASLRQPEADDGSTLFTDASDEAMGAVLLERDSMLTFSRLFDRDEADSPIFLRELGALLEGLRWAHAQGKKPSVVCVDNSAAVAIYRKGHSTDPTANKMMADAPWVRGIAWIPSACNISDEPSRNKPRTRTPCHHNHPSRRTIWTG